jgi:hypothetical protein
LLFTALDGTLVKKGDDLSMHRSGRLPVCRPCVIRVSGTGCRMAGAWSLAI